MFKFTPEHQKRLDKLSKKEAGLLIRIIQAIFDDRPSNRN